MNKDELLAMELHQTISIESGLEVVRVYGGWLYRIWAPVMKDGDWCAISCTFVPEVLDVYAKTIQGE